MRINSFRCLFILLMIVFTQQIIAQKGHEINVKIPNLAKQTLMLGHYLGSTAAAFPDDTIKLDSKGAGSFKGSKPLSEGIYFILLPSRIPVDILIGENQRFSLEMDTTNILETQKFTNCKECNAFLDFEKFSSARYKAGISLAEKYKTASKGQKDSIALKEKELIASGETFLDNQLKNFPANTMLGVYLKSLRDVKVPDFPRDGTGKVLDSAFRYHYSKAHYFDNFNYMDARLLMTPLYEQKILSYLDQMVIPMVDSLNLEVDRLLDNTRNNQEVFKAMLILIFQHYAKSQLVGMDDVLIHIADKYYIPYATWSNRDYIESLKKDIGKLKPTMLGKQAPDLQLIELPADHFMVAKMDTALKSNPYLGNYIAINSIKAKFLVLAFWEADCGHCQKAIPLLHEAYQKLKDKGVAVLAVHAISSVPGKRKWVDFVNDHEMYDWINAWSPYSNDYRNIYNLQAFPAIYVLDENKKILYKRISAEQVEDAINFEIRKANSHR